MNEIACASGVELLMDYLEDQLPAEVRAALDAHVSGCARCVAFVTSYRETPRIIRDATLVQMPGEVQAALIEAIRAARRRN
jgi:anti-sigma factor RsiW